MNFNLKLKMLFVKDYFHSFFSMEKSISKYKSMGVQLSYHSKTLFQIGINIDLADPDPEGISIELCLFGLAFDFQIYDRRRWDYRTNSWSNY